MAEKGWLIAGETDVGRVREHNEDAIGWSDDSHTLVLADGMGGHLAGEVASAMAVETILGRMAGGAGERGEALQAALEEANRRIHESGRSDPTRSGMGATVVAATLDGEQLHFAHVGDSRLYRLRGGQLERLTRDHTLVQEMIDEGYMDESQARDAINGHIVTRALGSEAQVEVTRGCERVEAGDLFLACCDGLSDTLSDEQLRQLLSGGGGLEEQCRALVALANGQGGGDNISVILMRPL